MECQNIHTKIARVVGNISRFACGNNNGVGRGLFRPFPAVVWLARHRARDLARVLPVVKPSWRTRKPTPVSTWALFFGDLELVSVAERKCRQSGATELDKK
jgi:hypothetical protein